MGHRVYPRQAPFAMPPNIASYAITRVVLRDIDERLMARRPLMLPIVLRATGSPTCA